MERRKHGFIAAAAVLTGAAAGVVPMDAAADDFYWIQFWSSSQCLDNFARSGAAVIFDCGSQKNQHWTWSGTTSWIVSRERVYGQAKCLGTFSETYGEKVEVYDCFNPPGPQSLIWTWVADRAGWVLYKGGTRLCVKASGYRDLVLGVYNESCMNWSHIPMEYNGAYVNWP